MFENIYQSKYKGKEVDSAVEKVLSNKFATQESLEQINTNKLDKGAKISELINDGDGNSKFITEKKTSELLKEINSNLTNKVDKEDNKGLSSNDFTDDEKAKLESLPNSTELNNRMNLKADKSEMNNLIAKKVDKEAGKGLSSNDYTDSEKSKLGGLPDSTEFNNRMNLKADKEAMENLLAGKVDKVVGKDLSSNDFTDYEKNKLAHLENYDDSAIYEELEKIDSKKQNIMSPIVVPTEDVGDEFVWIYPDGKTMFYSIEFKNSEWATMYALLISTEDLPKDTEYTFYVYVKIGEVGLSFPPSLDIQIGSAETLTWIEEPTIEYPCTKMLLAFQTTDGGASWIANQCYSLEVTE